MHVVWDPACVKTGPTALGTVRGWFSNLALSVCVCLQHGVLRGERRAASFVGRHCLSPNHATIGGL